MGQAKRARSLVDMASLHFYATTKDLHDLVRFIYAETDCRVFEPYSRRNMVLREFETFDDFEIEDPAKASHGKLHLHFISPSVSTGPGYRRFELTEKAGGGYRYNIEDPSNIRLVEGGIRNDIEGEPLYWTEIACWSAKGAWQRSNFADDILEAIDWKELEKISRKILYHVRSRMAVAKYLSRPILADAYQQMENGLKLWRGPGLIDISDSSIQK